MQDRTNQICDSTSTTTKFQHLRDVFQANASPSQGPGEEDARTEPRPPVEPPSPLM